MVGVRWPYRATLNKHKPWKCQRNWTNCASESLEHHQWIKWHRQRVIWVSSSYPQVRFEHAPCHFQGFWPLSRSSTVSNSKRVSFSMLRLTQPLCWGWLHGYDPKTKQPSSQWESLQIAFFFLTFAVSCTVSSSPQGQTVNAEFYCTVLRCQRENIWWKRPELWRNGNWVLQHDNAPAHNALKTREFYRGTNTIVAPHPPYSPDLAPRDFFLFPKVKFKLEGRSFDTVEEIQRESQILLDTLTERDFQGAFQD